MRDPAAVGADALYCHRCERAQPAERLDRLLWCEDCRAAARRSAGRWARLAALLAAAALALWIGLAIGPSDRFLIFWAAAVVIAYRLGRQLAAELGYGIMRIRNRPGVRVSAGRAAQDPE